MLEVERKTGKDPQNDLDVGYDVKGLDQHRISCHPDSLTIPSFVSNLKAVLLSKTKSVLTEETKFPIGVAPVPWTV